MTPPMSVLDYDIKQSVDEASVLLELWGIRSSPLLPSLPGQYWPGVVALYTVLCMGQIELNYVITLN